MPIRVQLGVDIAIGLLARLVLAVSTSYRGLDADTFGAWAQAMHDHPLGQFYARAPTPDHLPGDLWILKGIQVAFTAFGGHDFGAGTFEFLTNAVPMVADVVVGLLLFSIVRTWHSEHVAARAARWYLLNPSVILVAGAWGQWDSVSIALLLFAILAVLGPGRLWITAAPALTWAVLIKPQLVVPTLILLLWIRWTVSQPRGEPRPTSWWAVGRAGAFVLLGATTAVALLEPFRVGLLWRPDHGTSLLARVQYAADLHEFTTMGAANLWMVVDRNVIGPPDDVGRWGDISAAEIGVLLCAVLWASVAITAWRAFGGARRTESVFWAAAAATFASCLALTRVHERYYFPVLLLLLLWAAIRGFDRVSAVFFWSFTALFVIDLVVPMGWTGHDNGVLHRPGVLMAVGLLHLASFGLLITLPWLRRLDSAITVDGQSATGASRRRGPG
jgi:hypothetical protein